ncbi:MAG TPA: hypothetical protein VHH73_14980, partial [Verrucomicrobiae bacterium]|nr:hypothetical protein [Verrucomicrobiae bacterium]
MSRTQKSSEIDGVPAGDSWGTLLELMRDIVGERLQAHFKNHGAPAARFEQDSRWQMFDRLVPEGGQLSHAEKLVFLLALTPHLQPGFWESIILHLAPNGGDFPELGGVKGSQHRGMLPTGETAQFIVAGMDAAARLELQRVFDTK